MRKVAAFAFLLSIALAGCAREKNDPLPEPEPVTGTCTTESRYLSAAGWTRTVPQEAARFSWPVNVFGAGPDGGTVGTKIEVPVVDGFPSGYTSLNVTIVLDAGGNLTSFDALAGGNRTAIFLEHPALSFPLPARLPSGITWVTIRSGPGEHIGASTSFYSRFLTAPTAQTSLSLVSLPDATEGDPPTMTTIFAEYCP